MGRTVPLLVAVVSAALVATMSPAFAQPVGAGGDRAGRTDAQIAAAIKKLPKPQKFPALKHRTLASTATGDLPAPRQYQPASARAARPTPGTHHLSFAAGQQEAKVAGTGISLRRLGTQTSGASPRTPVGPALAAATGRVQVLPDTTTRALGVDGLAFTVEALGGGSAARWVPGVDFSAWDQAGGGGFGDRLHLVRLPGCAATTPQLRACRTAAPVPARLDSAKSTITATAAVVDAAAATADTGATQANGEQTDGSTGATQLAVYALTTGASGDTGSFAATTLSASGSWSVSGASGGFTWSYPVPTPAPATGAAVAPSVALSYNSSSVDGKVATSNNQSSWVGLGWDYQPGFIERSYRTCADDDTLPSASQTPDLCWAGEVLTLQLPGGSSGRLVKDDTTGTWRVEQDNGARVEHLTGSTNGAKDGEYWRVTDTSGIRYYFGLNRPPGSTAAQATNSVLTVPVYGPHPGDQCYNAAGFAASRCTQAWRWGLDYVEDPNGNAAVYSYTKETNQYGPNGSTTGVGYDRAGYLTSIAYGMHNDAGTVYGSAASYKVLFSSADRCTGTGCSTSTDPTAWPDTPIDLECTTGAACQQHGPSFWTRKRLATITSQYLTATGTYASVDEVNLTQFYAANGLPTMNLSKIVRTGRGADGTAITLPAVQFGYADWANRVPGVDSRLSPMVMARLSTILTETGQSIVVRYNGDEGQSGRAKPVCTATTLPPDPSTNTTNCYPVSWTPPYAADPVLDYFHKYVVTQVSVSDINAAATSAPTRISTFTYTGDPAWHFDNNELVPATRRTYGQFRGYGTVEVRTGNSGSVSNGVVDAWTLTRTSYYRGMNGDHLPSGIRTVTLTATDGSSVPDEDGFADQVLETQTFDGANRVGSTITTMGVVATTATRVRSGMNPLKATIARPTKTAAITNVPAGGATVLRADTTVAYDTLGRALRSSETANGALPRCTGTSYADNTTGWIRDRVAETIVSGQACPAVGTAQTNIASQARVYYDNSTTLGAAPTAGNPTMTQTALDSTSGVRWSKTTTSYDAYGRIRTVTGYTNAADSTTARTTSTTYTPADTRPTTTVAVTNPQAQTATTTYDPAKGAPVKSVDVAGLTTEAKIDALGRVVAVWNPGQPRTGNANTTYTYNLTQTAPPSVITKSLVDPGHSATVGYVASVQIFNAFGDPRQAQTQTSTGRLVTETFVDSHGWVIRTENGWPTTGAPSTAVVATTASSIDSRTFTAYDTTGRPTTITSYQGTTAKFATRTVYSGNRTTTVPPTGGAVTTTVINGRGVSVENDAWTTPPTITGNTLTGGVAVRTTYNRDALDRLAGHTTAYNTTSAATWTTTFDLGGRAIATSDPDAGNATSSYDDLGNLTKTTDAKLQPLSYSYDKLGRKTGQYASAAPTGIPLASWTYDTLLAGRLTSATRTTGGKTYTTATTGYDAAGRPTGTRVSLNEAGFLPSYGSEYTYTSTGQLATKTLPVTKDPANPTRGGISAEPLEYYYNALGQLTGTAGYSVYVADTIYSPWGEVSQHVLGLNSTRATLTYDRDPNTHRVNHVDFSGLTADPQIDDLTYTYDNAGNITRTLEVQGGATAPKQTTCYTYDTLQQLTQAWSATDNCATNPATAGNSKVGGPQKFWHTWTLDALTGRRTKLVKNAVPAGPTATTTTYTYGYSNGTINKPRALASTSTTGATTGTSTYAYDANGATTTRTNNTTTNTIGYGPDQRTSTTTAPGGTINFINDADGNQLLRKDPGGVTTLYLPGTEIQYTTSTNKTKTTKYYDHDGTTVATKVDLGGITYLMRDHHNTGTVAFAATAQTTTRRYLDPYGNTLATGVGTWPNQRTFLDKQANPAGIIDIGAREYDPTTGRFLTVDPILDPTDTLQNNGYAYANNNPLTFSDPTGLLETSGTGAATASDHARANEQSRIRALSGKTQSGGQRSDAGKPYEQRVATSVEQNNEFLSFKTTQYEGAGLSHDDATYRAYGDYFRTTPVDAQGYDQVKAAYCSGYGTSDKLCTGATTGDVIDLATFASMFFGIGELGWAGRTGFAGVRGATAKGADEAIAGVDDVLGGLAKGRSSGVRTVGSDAQLDDVYGSLTRGGAPIDVPGYKGSWIERSDGIRVGIRDASKSGGRTIDIRYPDGTTGKVHIG